MIRFFVAYLVSIACWFAVEMSLLVRDRVRRESRQRRDRGTRAVLVLAFAVAMVSAFALPSLVPQAATPARRGFALAGLALIWLGLAVRVWAVLTLGTSFRTVVHVEAGQPVVSGGPYRWIRHPSYAGLLVIALGCGLGAGNWLSIVVATVIPAAGLLARIRVEEAELARVLGEPYRAYQRVTRRLVPGLW
ncbi:MAG TPA: isoprenylcysteine carboxylmethyltransferase family protein [Micromonosporaceae bacterium]